jgi:hypothetical protein
MNLRSLGLLVPFSLLPVAVSAQTTVYTANFGSGELNPVTYDVGLDWTVASTKNSTVLTKDGTGLSFGIASTSSGFSEVQARVLSAPVTLSVAGDSVTLVTTFTNVSNLLASGASSLNFGLYNSASSNPFSGLANSKLNATDTDFAAGGVQNWNGYVSRFLATGSPTLFTRAAQTDTVNENQDLLFSNVGNGAYDLPTGNTIATATSTTIALTTGNSYTVSYSVTLNAGGGHDISSTLYSGVGTGGSVLASVGGTIAVPLTSSFDGLAIGFRDADTATALADTMKITSLAIIQVATVPEPSTCAALAGLAGLGLALVRRRRA